AVREQAERTGAPARAAALWQIAQAAEEAADDAIAQEDYVAARARFADALRRYEGVLRKAEALAGAEARRRALTEQIQRLLVSAEDRLDLGEADAAERMVRQALELDPHDPRALALLERVRAHARALDDTH